MSDMPSAGQAAKQAWRETIAAFRILPNVALVALLITIVVGVVQSFLLPQSAGLEAGLLLGSFVIGAVQAFLITPYLIAVHRLIILGEVAPGYALTPGDPRFQRFFGWSIALSLLWLVPSLVGLLLTDSPIVYGLLSTVLGFAFLIVSLRIMILFPALAVDAPGAMWSNAMADTKGRAWRIFLILLLSALPVIGVIIVIVIISGGFEAAAGASTRSTAATLLAGVMQGAANLVSLTLAVVIASRLYEWLGDRVKQGA